MSRLTTKEFLVWALIRDRRCMDLSCRVRLDLGSLLEVIIIVLLVQPLMPESVSLLLLLLTVLSLKQLPFLFFLLLSLPLLEKVHQLP
jgi:hypothetical protein